MTETCLPIVTWLKNWFTSKDNEIHYNITSSNYNPNIDSTVTITVTVTDGNGALVDGHSFILNANGTDVSLTTSNGVATYSYTCSNWGVCRFSVKSYSCFINIVGWKQVYTSSDGKLKAYQSDDKVRLVSNGYNVSATITWARVGSSSFLSQVKPSMPVVQINNDYTIIFRVDNNGDLYFRSISGTVSNKNNYFQMDWTI